MSEIFSSSKINTIIFFNYCAQLTEFTQWAQQLFAESLGKQGKGLTPVISNGPRDHHSLLQLYLDGPRDKVFYIFSSKDIYNYRVQGNYNSALQENLQLNINQFERNLEAIQFGQKSQSTYVQPPNPNLLFVSGALNVANTYYGLEAMKDARGLNPDPSQPNQFIRSDLGSS